MGNPNPFYRFSKAWNAGFYPDNQIMSDLLNEIRNDLVTYVATIPWSGKTINQWYNLVKQFINTYTQSPYFGEFDFTIQKISDIPNWEYNINIFNPDLTATTPGQVITINGFFNNTTQQVVNANVNAFTPGSYSVNVDVTLIQEEVKAREALRVVDLNGSAFFPITYKYNPTTFAAISGLARAKDLQLLNGEINRLPPAIMPYKNQRTFELPQLDADDKYIISIMERIIQASLVDDDFTTFILPTYQQFQANEPDGWTFSYSNPSYTTYERVQFDFVNSSRRKFILVGRKDGVVWLWQRFVSDSYNNAPYNFLTAYTETTQLPYEPNQAGRYIYNDDTFDFEFVEFTSGCYVSPEFYAMPAKPGDQFQFNVVDGNLEGIDSVNVGLFTESGQLVQKIGEAVRLTGSSCNNVCSHAFSYVLAAEDVETYLTTINNAIPESPLDPITTLKWEIESDEPGQEQIGFFILTSEVPPFTMESITSLAAIFNITVTESEGSYTFSYTANNLACGFNYTFSSSLTGGTSAELFASTSYECQCENYTIEQLQASVTIPSKQGCYRMGLYNEPSSTCELTFEKVLEGEDLEAYIIQINSIASSLNPFIGFSIDGVNFDFMEVGAGPYTAETLSAAINANIVGMNTEVYLCNPPSAIQCMSFTYIQTVDCGEATYSLIHEQTDSGGSPLGQIWRPEGSQTCECSTSYSLYSLSNIINIDASDCFSTMIEFWQDSDSIAQGFEYFNGWKQRVRIGLNGGGEKPIIEESLYRQSNGVTRRPQNKQDLSVDLHTDFFDLDTQLAMTDATRYPYFIWEGKSIFVRGDVEVATTQDFTNQSSFETLSQMKFQALIQGFQPRNSSCLTC